MKPTYIEFFPEGSRVTLVGLEDLYKNVTVVHVSDCSVSIDGQFKDSDDVWKPLGGNYTISCHTLAVYDESDRILAAPMAAKLKEAPDENNGISAKQLSEKTGWSYAKTILFLKNKENASVVGEVKNPKGRPTVYYKLLVALPE